MNAMLPSYARVAASLTTHELTVQIGRKWANMPGYHAALLHELEMRYRDAA